MIAFFSYPLKFFAQGKYAYLTLLPALCSISEDQEWGNGYSFYYYKLQLTHVTNILWLVNSI